MNVQNDHVSLFCGTMQWCFNTSVDMQWCMVFFFVLFFSKHPFVYKYLDDKLLIFKKLHSRSCFSDKICRCPCLRAHTLTVNLVSSQTVTPCRCFWFHGGRCTRVIPEQEEVKAGESAALALEEELEISVRSTCQVRRLHVARTVVWSAMCSGEWRSWALWCVCHYAMAVCLLMR